MLWPIVLLIAVAMSIGAYIYNRRGYKTDPSDHLPPLPAIGVLLLIFVIMFWCGFLNHVSVNEIGVAYNSIDGSIIIQDKPGWYFTPPTVQVGYQSTLPMRVTIQSDANLINTRLVRFVPEGIDEFIKLQGFSMLMKNKQANVMLGYAFSGRKYSFMEILEDPDNSPASSDNK